MGEPSEEKRARLYFSSVLTAYCNGSGIFGGRGHEFEISGAGVEVCVGGGGGGGGAQGPSDPPLLFLLDSPMPVPVSQSLNII